MKLLTAFLLISAAVLFPAAAQTVISVEAYPQAYLSFDESYDSQPLRIQYGGTGSLNIYQEIYSPLFITTGVGFGMTDQSQTYGGVVQRAFTSLSGNAGITLRNDNFGVSVKTHGLFSTFTGTYVKFAHLGFTFEPSMRLITNPFNLSVLGVFGYDWRWDIDHNLYAGIGFKVDIIPRGKP